MNFALAKDLGEVVDIEEDHFTTLRSDYAAPSRRLLTLLSILLPRYHFDELFVAKNFIYLKLLHFVLNSTLGRVYLPGVVADREPVLLIHCNLCLHNQPTAQEDVEDVRGAAQLVNGLVSPIFLLAEVTVELLDGLGGPSLESRHLM